MARRSEGTEAAAHTPGEQLLVGDTLRVWWGRDTITSLRPYIGPLSSLFECGASIASFARGSAMTIDHAHTYEVVGSLRGQS